MITMSDSAPQLEESISTCTARPGLIDWTGLTTDLGRTGTASGLYYPLSWLAWLACVR